MTTIGTVTANPSIDQHILIDKLVKDDAIRALAIRRDPGGKGINVSRVIKELGGDTVAFGVAGGCAGYMLKSLMAERGIAFESIEVKEETRINVIVTDRSDRTQTRISVRGPWIKLDETEQLLSKITDHEPLPEWWVLGGSLPPGMPEDFYSRLITALQQRGAKCLLDTDGTALKIGVEAKPYLIKPNEYELSRLVDRPLSNEEAVSKAAHEVLSMGVGIVAVTLGGQGALVVGQGRAFRALAPPVEVRSKVGAGDSFLAGTALALSSGQSLDTAVRLGTAAGTAAVMKEGTQLCRREDVERLTPQVTVQPFEYSVLPAAAVGPFTVRDVVCGMEIAPQIVSFAATYGGREYRFCSLKCEQEFINHPERFFQRAGGQTDLPTHRSGE